MNDLELIDEVIDHYAASKHTIDFLAQLHSEGYPLLETGPTLKKRQEHAGKMLDFLREIRVRLHDEKWSKIDASQKECSEC